MNTPTNSTRAHFGALDGWDLFAEKLLDDTAARTHRQDAPPIGRSDDVAVTRPSVAEDANGALIPEIVSPNAAGERRASMLPARLDPPIGATSVAAEVVERARRQAEISERHRKFERSRIRRLLRRSVD